MRGGEGQKPKISISHDFSNKFSRISSKPSGSLLGSQCGHLTIVLANPWTAERNTLSKSEKDSRQLLSSN